MAIEEDGIIFHQELNCNDNPLEECCRGAGVGCDCGDCQECDGQPCEHKSVTFLGEGYAYCNDCGEQLLNE